MSRSVEEMSFTSSCGSELEVGFQHSIDSITTPAVEDEGDVERRKSLTIMSLELLNDVSLEGDLPSLLNLLQEDPLILYRCINERQWSPLHMAASKGNIEIVKTLLNVKPNMCFARDREGKNPAHVAAIEGHIDVLQLFYERNFHAIRERTNNGETILHLCVKHNHINALEIFLDITNDVELLNSKDIYGNTILHLAVMGKQVEMVKLILKQPMIAKNAINNDGLTAVDYHIRYITRTNTKLNWFESINNKDEIWVSLIKVEALRAKDELSKIKDKDWVENQSQMLIVVASLIATMAFQVILCPPRGFWQDGKIAGPNDDIKDIDRVQKFFKFHDAGAPIARDLIPRLYHQLMIWNTIAFAFSLGVIFILISGIFYGRCLIRILRRIMWISVTATFATYSLSLTMINWYYKPTYENFPNPGPPPPSSNGPPTAKFDKNTPVSIVWTIVVPILLLIVPFLLFLAKIITKRLRKIPITSLIYI